MVEIAMALGFWTSAFVLVRSYRPKHILPLSTLIALVGVYLLVTGAMQFGSSDFWESDGYLWSMAILLPLSIWVGNIRRLAIISQYGEDALNRKFGPPKLDLATLQDRSLAKLARVSTLSLFLMTGVLIIEAMVR